jgi:hypothetical protein
MAARAGSWLACWQKRHCKPSSSTASALWWPRQMRCFCRDREREGTQHERLEQSAASTEARGSGSAGASCALVLYAGGRLPGCKAASAAGRSQARGSRNPCGVAAAQPGWATQRQRQPGCAHQRQRPQATSRVLSRRSRHRRCWCRHHRCAAWRPGQGPCRRRSSISRVRGGWAQPAGTGSRRQSRGPAAAAAAAAGPSGSPARHPVYSGCASGLMAGLVGTHLQPSRPRPHKKRLAADVTVLRSLCPPTAGLVS